MIFLNVSGEFAYNETLVNVTFLLSQIIGTPLNCFTFFIIWKYSTSDMKDYKIHLLLYQLGSASLDFGVDVLATPVLFFPYVAGTSQGILHNIFGMDSFLVAVYHHKGKIGFQIIMFTYLAFVLHFILVNPLFYRWQVVLPNTSCMKIKGRKKLFLCQFGYLLLNTSPIPIIYSQSWEDNEINKESFREDANLADVNGFCWVNTKKHPSFMYALAWQGIWLVYMVFMVILCNVSIISTLEQLKNHMSPATRELHIKFLRTIGLQTMVPMLWLEIPCSYMLIAIFAELRFRGHQDVNNLSIAFACSHGAVGAIILLFSNPCYRRGIYSIFFQSCKKTTPVTTLTIPSSRMDVTTL